MKKLLLILTVTCGLFVGAQGATGRSREALDAFEARVDYSTSDAERTLIELQHNINLAAIAGIDAEKKAAMNRYVAACVSAKSRPQTFDSIINRNDVKEAQRLYDLRIVSTWDAFKTGASALKESAFAMAKKTCSGLSRYPLAVPAVAVAAAGVLLPSSRPLLAISAATAGVAFGAYKAMNVASLRTAVDAASRFASGLYNFAKNTVKCPTATGLLGLATWSLIRTPGRFVKAYANIEKQGNYVPAVMVPVVTVATAGIAYLAAKKLWQYRAPAVPAPATPPVRVQLVKGQAAAVK